MDALSFLYSLNSLIIGAAFLPQIVTLVKDRSGAVSTSIATWLIFSFVSLISLVYGIYKLHDTLFIICGVVSLLGNGTVLALSIYRRRQRAFAKIS